MMGLTEASKIALASALISGMTLIVVSLIGTLLGTGQRKRGEAARRDHTELIEAVKPANGHPDLGSGIHAIEDKVNRLADAVDRVEVKQDETGEALRDHIDEVSPLTEWVAVQMALQRQEEGE
jgi:hypothetical protein